MVWYAWIGRYLEAANFADIATVAYMLIKILLNKVIFV